MPAGVVRLTGMKLIALAVIVMAASGCLELETNVVHGDVTFTAAERVEIERGNVWIAERVGKPAYEIVWDLPHPSDPDSYCRHCVIRTTPDARTWGLGSWAARVTLALEPGVQGDSVAILAAHEFGHTHRLEHLPADVAGIMNPNTEPALTWTDADQAQCVADGVCSAAADDLRRSE